MLERYMAAVEGFEGVLVEKRSAIGGSFALAFFQLEGGPVLIPGGLDIFTPGQEFEFVIRCVQYVLICDDRC